MREVLKALNQLVHDGLIDDYAIGGAIGAAFYIKAAETEDIDAFVVLRGSQSGLVLLTPIYAALTAMGGVAEREYVRFGEWPLQILTDANALITEAIHDAISTEFDGIPARSSAPSTSVPSLCRWAGRRITFALRCSLNREPWIETDCRNCYLDTN